MADQIKLETVGLGEILASITTLRSDVHTTREGVSKVIAGLEWEVGSKEQINSQLENAIKELKEQEQKLDAMEVAVKDAITQADGFNAEISKLAAAILTYIIAVVSSVFSSSNNGVVQNLTKMRDWLGEMNRGEISGNGDNNSNINGSSGLSKNDGDAGNKDNNTESNLRGGETNNLHFNIRKSTPSYGDKYYNKEDNDYWSGKPNCTWYAYGRAYEIVGEDWRYRTKGHNLGKAATWYESLKKLGFETGKTPKAGSIAVWSGGSTGEGHVSIVEELLEDGSAVYTESAAHGGVWYSKYGKNYNLTASKSDSGLYNYYGPSTLDWGSVKHTESDLDKLTAGKVPMKFLGYVYLK